ncbi:MAG: 50S ribosomal protein L19e [Candidatus Woesearchaeota archaeon]
MKLNVQKRLAADISKCSPKRIRFDESELELIKESITKMDLRGLLKDKVIRVVQKKGVSRARANKRKTQRIKGRRKGHGSRKGTKKTRNPKKEMWMNKIRLQRKLIKKLRDNELVTKKTYNSLYLKSKGGFFRSKKHLKLYIDEHDLLINKK